MQKDQRIFLLLEHLSERERQEVNRIYDVHGLLSVWGKVFILQHMTQYSHFQLTVKIHSIFCNLLKSHMRPCKI